MAPVYTQGDAVIPGIGLPGKINIHEFSIIERFCYAIEDGELRDEMLFRIKSRGAIRMFKKMVSTAATLLMIGTAIVKEPWMRLQSIGWKRIISNITRTPGKRVLVIH
jgi:hypothetical protein